MLLPLGVANVGISGTQAFGSNTNDLSAVGQTSANGQARVFGRTFRSNGDDATDGNALEFLAVT